MCLKRTLSDEAKRAIEKIISSEDRAEIIPVKNGEVKVVHIKREEVRA